MATSGRRRGRGHRAKRTAGPGSREPGTRTSGFTEEPPPTVSCFGGWGVMWVEGWGVDGRGGEGRGGDTHLRFYNAEHLWGRVGGGGGGGGVGGDGRR